MKFYIDRVVGAGTRNAVVELDSGALLKVDLEQARAGSWIEFDGDQDAWIQSISPEVFRRVKPGDEPPKILDSFLY